MVIVKLRETKRYFEADDSEYYIQGKQELEMPEKHIRSYSIKHALFHGNLLIIEGELLFKFKAGLVYISKDILYCKEYDKYFFKDLELDTITYVVEDEVPKYILAKLNGEENGPEGQDEIVKKEVISEDTTNDGEAETEESKEDTVEEIEFEKMSKKALKAYIKENKLEIDTTNKGGMIKALKSL